MGGVTKKTSQLISQRFYPNIDVKEKQKNKGEHHNRLHHKQTKIDDGLHLLDALFRFSSEFQYYAAKDFASTTVQYPVSNK